MNRRIGLSLHLPFLVIAFAMSSHAQETAAQRAAARGVLEKMAALEESLDVPALVARLTVPNATRDQVVNRARALMDKDLLALSDD